MSSTLIVITLVSLFFLIVAGIYAVVKKDLLQAAIATGLISLVLSILFFILQAPDVALTEAAIGIALSTIIFVLAIRNTKRFEDDKK